MYESFEVRLRNDNKEIPKIPYSSKGNRSSPLESEGHNHNETSNISQRFEVLHREALLYLNVHTSTSITHSCFVFFFFYLKNSHTWRVYEMLYSNGKSYEVVREPMEHYQEKTPT